MTMAPSPPAAHLPPRFEIRQLGPEHLEWVSAMQLHANIFHSAKWRPVFKGESAKRCLVALRLASNVLLHSLRSGLSYGVFDREYVYKRPSSATSSPLGGRLYWHEFGEEGMAPGWDDEGEVLLEAMDFPLVSFALAYDEFSPTPRGDHAGMAKALPEMMLIYEVMDRMRREKGASSPLGGSQTKVDKVTAPGQKVGRSGTVTRRDYEGLGLMKGLAAFEMEKAKEMGYRSIMISTSSDAVTHVWTHPPAPFRSRVVLTLDVKDYKMLGKDGVVETPFETSGMKTSTTIECLLDDGGEAEAVNGMAVPN